MRRMGSSFHPTPATTPIHCYLCLHVFEFLTFHPVKSQDSQYLFPLKPSPGKRRYLGPPSRAPLLAGNYAQARNFMLQQIVPLSKKNGVDPTRHSRTYPFPSYRIHPYLGEQITKAALSSQNTSVKA
ncbi:hypothetical protein ONS95_012806 [Cadophora gregata]|uniref:uncharacterized protein n=1 Tax=Cadophora gregata TaxID=51156 RepID=UPI0026DDB2D3|nr:uncharacterized protein ONS95_012806 [Cadophora gregata]KAK0101212.1 hypothetical protein ONS96_006434 [Cadophora gregata f. sp. sojae]KAK0115753.1 hypothetical protein ONS95_012806 [Cadophora gregata]